MGLGRERLSWTPQIVPLRARGFFSLHPSQGVIPPGDEDMERGEEEVEGVSGMN